MFPPESFIYNSRYTFKKKKAGIGNLGGQGNNLKCQTIEEHFSDELLYLGWSSGMHINGRAN